MRTMRDAVLGTALAFGAAGCSSTELGNWRDHHYFHKVEKPHVAEWGYDGANGPEHWGDLAPEYSLAKDGHQQSPIDLRDATEVGLPDIRFQYNDAPINLIYNGHTIEEKENDASSIVVEGKTYVLQQFHFHSPSEHTVDGRHAEMELHLVHKSVDDELAVVGVFINAGAENDAFAPVWSYLPSEENRTRQADVTINAADLLPEDHRYYRYRGSLTTPPCSERVLWFVLREPVELSMGQVNAFRAIIEGNNRPTQPLNGRLVEATP